MGCNCGCDTADREQIASLRKQVAVLLLLAVMLGWLAISTLSADHSHPALLAFGIAAQVLLIARALQLFTRRRRLLQGHA